MQALAQAFADEQTRGDAAELRSSLDAMRAERDSLAVALRRAVGVICDLERTRTESRAVLDDYGRRGPFLVR